MEQTRERERLTGLIAYLIGMSNLDLFSIRVVVISHTAVHVRHHKATLFIFQCSEVPHVMELKRVLDSLSKRIGVILLFQDVAGGI